MRSHADGTEILRGKSLVCAKKRRAAHPVPPAAVRAEEHLVFDTARGKDIPSAARSEPKITPPQKTVRPALSQLTDMEPSVIYSAS